MICFLQRVRPLNAPILSKVKLFFAHRVVWISVVVFLVFDFVLFCFALVFGLRVHYSFFQ